MASNGKKIAIILPAFNEAAVIGDVLDRLPPSIVINKTKYSVQIIVVNDASTDNTAKVVSLRKHVHLINHIVNSGAGAATRTGISYAKNIRVEYAATMDSDGQHDPNDVVRTLEAVVTQQADFIIGSRLIETTGMPWYRVIGNKGLSFITFLVFGVFVKDSQSGLRAFNKKALSQINYRSNGYAFCSEMIWRAKKEHLTIKEIPIQAIYTEYSLTKGQSNWGAVHIVSNLVKHRLMEFIDG
jgi:glycosyltransferase involved in cell wall biosynthesis